MNNIIKTDHERRFELLLPLEVHTEYEGEKKLRTPSKEEEEFERVLLNALEESKEEKKELEEKLINVLEEGKEETKEEKELEERMLQAIIEASEETKEEKKETKKKIWVCLGPIVGCI